MAVITVIGAGMMGSAITFPAADNGNTIRIVGTPLDREIIDHARATGEHLTLKRKMPAGITYYQYEEFAEALAGADLLIGGVSSFGLDWFIENIIPVIPEELPVLSITKGMVHLGAGKLISYPEVYRSKTDKKISFNAVGGPCTSYELADHDPTEVTFCGENIEQLRWIRSLFETDYYNFSGHVYKGAIEDVNYGVNGIKLPKCTSVEMVPVSTVAIKYIEMTTANQYPLDLTDTINISDSKTNSVPSDSPTPQYYVHEIVVDNPISKISFNNEKGARVKQIRILYYPTK